MSRLKGDHTDRPDEGDSTQPAPEEAAADALGAADSDEARQTGPDDDGKAR